jgi:hypothetical protein
MWGGSADPSQTQISSLLNENVLQSTRFCQLHRERRFTAWVKETELD